MQILFNRQDMRKFGSPDVDERRYVAKKFLKLAEYAHNKGKLTRSMMPRLVGLLSDRDVIVRQCATGALGHLAIDLQDKERIAAAGAIPVLVTLLSDGDRMVLRQALFALGRLACGHPQTKGWIVDSKGVEPLVALLSDQEDPEVRANAAAVLFNLVGHGPMWIKEVGGMNWLMKLLSDERVAAVRRYAARASWHLAVDPQYREQIIKAGAISLWVKRLSDEDALVRQNVTGVLRDIASDDEGRQEVARVGGVPALVALIVDRDTLTRQRALDALGSFSVRHHSEILAREEVVGRLVNLLLEEDVHLKFSALRVLRVLIYKSVIADRLFCEAGGLEMLVAVLLHGDLKLSLAAGAVLGVVSPSAREQFAAALGSVLEKDAPEIRGLASSGHSILERLECVLSEQNEAVQGVVSGLVLKFYAGFYKRHESSHSGRVCGSEMGASRWAKKFLDFVTSNPSPENACLFSAVFAPFLDPGLGRQAIELSSSCLSANDERLAMDQDHSEVDSSSRGRLKIRADEPVPQTAVPIVAGDVHGRKRTRDEACRGSEDDRGSSFDECDTQDASLFSSVLGRMR